MALPKINLEPYGCISSSVGELCVFSITIGGLKELYKELGRPISECEPIEFVRRLTRHICFQKEVLREGKYKPDKPVLTADNIELLTVDNLQEISKIYIENNEYLAKKRILRNRETDQDRATVDSNEVDYPQQENESFVQYLTRLFSLEEETITEQLKGLSSTLKGFSDSLGDSIKNTFLLGDSLINKINNVRSPHEVSIKSIESSFPKINFEEIGQKIEENRLRPFNDLSSRLDQLIETSNSAADFLVKANEIQTRIAGEIKSSGDVTTKLAGINIYLTVIIIILTVLIPVCTALFANNGGDIKSKEVQEYVNSLTKKLTDINESIVSQNEPFRVENERLRMQTEKQESEIAEMKSHFDRQSLRVLELENKLKYFTEQKSLNRKK